MCAKSLFYGVVRTALEKDGWSITGDPLHLWVGRLMGVYLDLGAENLIAAQKGEQTIAVAVENFVGSSPLSEFHLATGHFINYRYALEEEDPERLLFLAIPQNVDRGFFNIPFIRGVLYRSRMQLMVYDIEQEVVLQWQR